MILLVNSSVLYAEKNILQVFENSYQEDNLIECLKNGLKGLGIDISKEISDEKLSIINYILKHTYENNIHQMRGETENKVYLSEDGREAVYDKNGNLVTNDYNRGSFNYASYDEPIDKFLLDFFPWMIWGNTQNDPTKFAERFYYYCYDLNVGIQWYIFLEDANNLEKIIFYDLDENEKLVYHLFNYLIFNENYKIKLNSSNISKLQTDANFYWNYFYQIMGLVGYEI